MMVTMDTEQRLAQFDAAVEETRRERDTQPAPEAAPSGGQPPYAVGAVGGTPAGQGPQIGRREAWLDLPAELYGAPGARLKVWANAPRRLLDDLNSGDPERIAAALHSLVLEHNGWRDYDGVEYPPAAVPGFWEGERSIPTELAAGILTMLVAGVHTLPKSLLPRSRR